jgi:hypothetical protein
MAIEIKELHIKVNILQEEDQQHTNTKLAEQDLQKLQHQIIEKCYKKVLEKLKELEER